MNVTNIDNQSLVNSEQIAKVFEGTPAHKHVCPVKDILSRFGDKWTIYAVLVLGQHQKMRFNELKNSISGISQRMLTVTLRSLEEDGIIVRTIYPEIPPRVEYELTGLGKSLLDQIYSLAQWANEHFQEILKARKRYQKRNT